MNPRVKTISALTAMKLQLAFLDGRRAMFDVSPFVDYPAFARLKDPAYFNRAVVDHGTVVWLGGIDFDPDTLHLDSQSE